MAISRSTSRSIDLPRPRERGSAAAAALEGKIILLHLFRNARLGEDA
jgi:hypothetical protein